MSRCCFSSQGEYSPRSPHLRHSRCSPKEYVGKAVKVFTRLTYLTRLLYLLTALASLTSITSLDAHPHPPQSHYALTQLLLLYCASLCPNLHSLNLLTHSTFSLTQPPLTHKRYMRPHRLICLPPWFNSVKASHNFVVALSCSEQYLCHN
eukprot:GHVN01095433.1.p1 GENE.GHVN01095433.1~~GHVN01095433.1.p1  ORF type:complete len:150 (-),score=39.03 GHVN01095433.1:215-664(-)